MYICKKLLPFFTIIAPFIAKLKSDIFNPFKEMFLTFYLSYLNSRFDSQLFRKLAIGREKKIYFSNSLWLLFSIHRRPCTQ